MKIKQPNELLAAARKWCSESPNVEDDVRGAIWRHGIEAVRSAVERQAKTKKGRPSQPDWPELLPVIEADAREWLAGGDPFSARSNYAIANEFANRSRGQSFAANHRRISRKLSKERKLKAFVKAQDISRDNHPYADHIRALRALSEVDSSEIWKIMLEDVERTVSDYSTKLGSQPPAELSFDEIVRQLNSKQSMIEGAASQLPQAGIGSLTVYNPSIWGSKT